jgi:plasmid stabilization system protein ParE
MHVLHVSTRVRPRPFHGRKPVAEFTRRQDVAPSLEYLDAALEDAESAAEWYGQRSATAARGFAEEIDAAVAAIERLPNAWPAYDQGTHRYLLRRYPFSIIYRIEPKRILIIAVAHGHRRPAYWRARIAGQIRIGFFEAFKGANTLLIEVDEEGLASLIDRIADVGRSGKASILGKWSGALTYGSITVAVERATEDAGLIVTSERDFVWRRSSDAWAEVSEKLRAMRERGPRHQYFDGPADAVKVMIAIGEYGQAWWDTHAE